MGSALLGKRGTEMGREPSAKARYRGGGVEPSAAAARYGESAAASRQRRQRAVQTRCCTGKRGRAASGYNHHATCIRRTLQGEVVEADREPSSSQYQAGTKQDLGAAAGTPGQQQHPAVREATTQSDEGGLRSSLLADLATSRPRATYMLRQVALP